MPWHFAEAITTTDVLIASTNSGPELCGSDHDDGRSDRFHKLPAGGSTVVWLTLRLGSIASPGSPATRSAARLFSYRTALNVDEVRRDRVTIAAFF